MTTNRARSVTGGGTEARLQGTIGLLLSCHRTTGGSHATCGTGPAPKRSGRFKSPADWPCARVPFPPRRTSEFPFPQCQGHGLRSTGGQRPKPGQRMVIPPYRLSWVTFHTFCHTWATWMRRFGGADLQGLVATGRWRDPRSAARYAHVVAHEDWDRANVLPLVGKSVELPVSKPKAPSNQG